jgi:hypothetical protein
MDEMHSWDGYNAIRKPAMSTQYVNGIIRTTLDESCQYPLNYTVPISQIIKVRGRRDVSLRPSKTGGKTEVDTSDRVWDGVSYTFSHGIVGHRMPLHLAPTAVLCPHDSFSKLDCNCAGLIELANTSPASA